MSSNLFELISKNDGKIKDLVDGLRKQIEIYK